MECKDLLQGERVDSTQLERLLDARKRGECGFLPVDVREPFEYEEAHIPGVDLLRPTSRFQEWAKTLVEEQADTVLILTCRTANRTGQVQRLLRWLGHPRVIDHSGGIVGWHGPVEGGSYGGD